MLSRDKSEPVKETTAPNTESNLDTILNKQRFLGAFSFQVIHVTMWINTWGKEEWYDVLFTS